MLHVNVSKPRFINVNAAMFLRFEKKTPRLKRSICAVQYKPYDLTNRDADIPSAEEIREILKTHNDFRANVKPPARDMFELRWNNEGAAKADRMTRRCSTYHDSDQDRKIPKYDTAGQNLAWNSDNVAWKDPIERWYNETKDFSYGGNNAGRNVLHFTQIVWAATKEIGCAKTKCPGKYIYTCNYYPKGNSDIGLPYLRSDRQACDGCLKGGVCSTGEYRGKLLKECDEFCVNFYNNCEYLAASPGYCMGSSKDKCTRSCKCKNGVPRIPLVILDP
ncbi:cysteine-rich venom protein-like [Gordionus sp. m RMFG-2023]|uniref:cysteine-rich venom protein-like n=1 Tax=Gordionus sp. m RMFG-2023 TaxID=3053472 RepID=UPI0031FC2CCC